MCVIAATESTQLASRNQVVDPGVSVLDDPVRIYYWAEDSNQLIAFAYLKVFAMNFWITLLIFVTICTFYLSFLQSCHHDLNDFVTELPQSLSVAFRALATLGYSNTR